MGFTLALPPQPAQAALAELPPGFIDEAVVSGLPYPTAIAFNPQGDMFVALKGGVVRVVVDGQLRPQPFVDISASVHDSNDRGLLGLTVHPEFPAKPYVYLLYTYDPPGVNQDQASPVAGRVSRLERFTADPAHGYLRAVPGSGMVILGTNSTRANIGSENNGRDTSRVSCTSNKTLTGTPIDDCLASDEDSHTIGTVAFANDGSLFVTNGDGSNYSEVDPRATRALNIDSLSGKVLRIDPETGQGLPDNPFFQPGNPGSNRSKVWSYGLRNPFRLTVHPDTGAPWVGDVGWNTWEEINTGKGANFGWPCYEGGAASGAEGANTISLQQPAYASSQGTTARCATLYGQGLSAVTPSVYAYNHSGGGASANVGTFYSGGVYPPEYRGALFITDFDRRWIRVLRFDLFGAVTNVSHFGRETGSGTGAVQLISGPDTNIYWVKYSSTGGEVRRIRYIGSGNIQPAAIATASAYGGTVPLEVKFSSLSSYDPDGDEFTVEWDFGDGSPVSHEYEPTHTFEEGGIYQVRLKVTEDHPEHKWSDTTLTIMAGYDPPLAIIDSVTPDVYAVGDHIEFRGHGTASGEPIPVEDHVWEVRLWHNDHNHYTTPEWEPDPADPHVSVGSIEVDEHGDETRYELCLRVRGPSDVWDVACEMALPDRVEYAVHTDPPGLAVVYEDEGVSLLTPQTIRPARNSHQTLTVPLIQSRRTFAGWSDGIESRSRTFVAGSEPRAFTAVYENRAPTVAISGPTAVPAGGTFNLQADSEEPEGDVVTYQWFLDDEPLGAGQVVSTSIAEIGTYEIKVLATDSLGGVGEATHAVEVRDPSVFGGGTYTLSYANRAALVGAGWDFLARTSAGVVRNTESSSGVTYSASGLGVQAGGGDLWAAENNTVNSVFRDLPSDWTGVEVDLGFAPSGNFQNAGIVLYVNDDNYVQLYRQYNTWEGGQVVGLVSETNGVPAEVNRAATATSLRLRLSRSGNVITGALSTNGGTTWTTVGTVTRTLTSPRLALITGANQAPGTPPTATYRSVIVTAPTPPPTTTTTTLPPTTTTTTTTTTLPPTTTTTTTLPPTTTTTTTTTLPPTTTTTTTTTLPPTTTTTTTTTTLPPTTTTTTTTTLPPTTTTTMPPPPTTGTFPLSYANRAALVGAGWDFLARTSAGVVRNTESGSGVTYSASGLGVQAGGGDLWAAENNTVNSVFRDLPSDWTGVEVDLGFAPSGNFQNAGIVLYVNDDNYVQLYRQYNTWEGGQVVGLVSETNGVPAEVNRAATATSLRLRLSRSGNVITGALSTNGGTTWTTVGTVTRTLTSPRLALITGANQAPGTPPTATYRSVIVTAP